MRQDAPPPEMPDLWQLAGEDVPPQDDTLWNQAGEPRPDFGMPVDENEAWGDEWEVDAGAGQESPDLWELAGVDPMEGGPDEPEQPRGAAKRAKKKAPRPYKHKRAKVPLTRRVVMQRVLLGVAALAVAGMLGLVAFFFHTTRNDDLWLDLDAVPSRTETLLLYTDPTTGETGVYARIPCTQDKEYLDPALMPQHLKDAFVAIEDRKFYTHSGVDGVRTLYALANEAWHGLTGGYLGGDSGRRQGASTIDQQLIKNLTRDDEDSSMAGYLRKLREICRALRLDAKYDKDQILGAYLNTISFTGNTAGVEAEAQKLFGKSAQQLTLAESASLAAITRNPARYNPAKNPEAHLERRDYVLALMLEQGYITQAQHDEAAAQPLELAGPGETRLPSYTTSYFTDTVIEEAVTLLASQRGITRREASGLIYNGGLRIYTTVHPQLQAAMEQTMESAAYHPMTKATVRGQLQNEDGSPMVDEAGEPVYGDVQITPQGAMVSLDYDGGICAIVGGLGEKTISRGFNRGTSAVRQVGSTMKPIGPYVNAIEAGYIHWSSSFLDDAVSTLKDPETGEETPWPANVTRSYTEKDILVRDALAHSVNTIAVRVGRQVGYRQMYRFVTQELGISTFVKADAAPGPMVLGSSTWGVSPMEMAMAYAMFGNGGYAVTPHSFTHIENGAGTVLLQVEAPKKRVISEDTAYIMNRLLRAVVTDGTAAGMSVPGDMDSVGKTGTTSDNRDHWFIGLTPYYVTASWYGYDENIRLDASSRNHPPTLAWRAVMQQGQQGLPYRDFPQSTAAVQAQYCTQSGYAIGSGCPSATGWYRLGKLPRKNCPLHG